MFLYREKYKLKRQHPHFTAALVISNDSPTAAYTVNLAGSCYQLSDNRGPYAGGNTITITNGFFGTITNVLVGGTGICLCDWLVGFNSSAG